MGQNMTEEMEVGVQGFLRGNFRVPFSLEVLWFSDSNISQRWPQNNFDSKNAPEGKFVILSLRTRV